MITAVLAIRAVAHVTVITAAADRYRGWGGSRPQRVTYTAFYPQPQQYGAAIRPMEQAQEQSAPVKTKKGKAAQPSQQVAFQQPPQIIISEARQDSYSDAESFDEHTDQE